MCKEENKFIFGMLAFILSPVFVCLLFVSYLFLTYDPPHSIETTGIVTNIEIKRSNNNKYEYRDKIIVSFDNSLTYVEYFKRGETPTSWKIGQKYLIWHPSNSCRISSCQLIRS